jgi:hypothetical protein
VGGTKSLACQWSVPDAEGNGGSKKNFSKGDGRQILMRICEKMGGLGALAQHSGGDYTVNAHRT